MRLDGHFQNAYVTRDLDKAVELFRTRYGIDNFNIIDAEIEIKTPTGRGPAVNRLGLAWVGNLQYELIEPVSGLVDIYRDALPETGTVRFHHVAMRAHDWKGLRDEIDNRGWKVVLEGGVEGRLQFLYVDARDSLGHYLEYMSMTPEQWTAMGGR